MRLLTHNSLRCARKDVSTGYPLRIHAEKCEVRKSPCNRDFILQMIPNLDWSTLRAGARDIGIDTLPEALNDNLVQDVNFVDALHHILMDVHVLVGQLECPESGTVFPILNGVPNMQ
jgi:multifunctional methyltransferase subunit TRM112